jgi:para-aminobenzoate synthetase component I
LQLLETLKWQSPLDIAAQIPEDEESWILLYSGMQPKYTGKYSIIALNKQEEIVGGFKNLENKLTADKELFTNSWFGYLGYGLKNELEKLAHDSPSFINTPDLWFARYGIIIIFDHEGKTVEVWGNEDSRLLWEMVKSSNNQNEAASKEEEIKNISSNMTRSEYIDKVNYIKEAIKRGDIYQANLTRKFYGEISGNPQYFDIFKKLCQISPAPYSAFIKNGDSYIISSSPERFLYIDKNGNANTRPIKGSLARGLDIESDKAAIINLQNSKKDCAENLMIVDLSRNDLSRNCTAGTINVDELFAIETYATVHHMASSINGKKQKNSSTLELIKGCFPAGSMTGTPKIKAMEICSQMEILKRGIYAGSIGWFGGDGSADLSVVIRTIILQGNKFEFQVGGAIVNDSEAHLEFEETMLKSKGIASTLGIPISSLESL